MKNTKKFVCYNFKGLKLGEISIDTELKNLRDVFLEYKTLIKAQYPGTAFIKPSRNKHRGK